MKLTKKLKQYLIQLPLIGIITLISGVFFTFVLFNTKEFGATFYMLIKITTVILAYMLIKHIGSGGNVNFYFTEHIPNEDEKKLDKLITQYRNTTLVIITAIFFIALDLILGFLSYNPESKFNINNSFGLFIGTIAGIGPLLIGVKYLSAWWNIKRNWEEIFGHK